jgi:hypothetical protein
MLYARAATATSTAVKDLALVGVELSDKLNVTEQAKSFAILAMQAKAGSIELRDLATKGPRIFAAAASAGATGEYGVRQAGALAQVYARGFGGSGAAANVATAIENTFADITKKQGRLEGIGIHVGGRNQFDVLKEIIVKASVGSGTKDKALLDRLVKESIGGATDEQIMATIAKSGGSSTVGKLQEVFNTRSLRGVLVMARDYAKSGKFKTYDELRDVAPDAGQLDRDFATRSSTGEAKLRAAQIGRERFFDKYFGGVAEYGAEHATELQLGSMALGGLGSGLGRAGGLLGRLGGTAGGLGGALSSATAQRVFVVNWPAGGLGDGGLGSTPGVSSLTKGAPLLTVAGGPAAIAAGALAYTGIHDTLLDIGMSEKTNPLMRKVNEDKRAGRLVKTEGAWEGFKSFFSQTPGFKEAPAPQVNITIHSNENLEVKGETGTRDPKVMDRRGGGGR